MWGRKFALRPNRNTGPSMLGAVPVITGLSVQSNGY